MVMAKARHRSPEASGGRPDAAPITDRRVINAVVLADRQRRAEIAAAKREIKAADRAAAERGWRTEGSTQTHLGGAVRGMQACSTVRGTYRERRSGCPSLV